VSSLPVIDTSRPGSVSGRAGAKTARPALVPVVRIVAPHARLPHHIDWPAAASSVLVPSGSIELTIHTICSV